jgi:hypothetical protein
MDEELETERIRVSELETAREQMEGVAIELRAKVAELEEVRASWCF